MTFDYTQDFKRLNFREQPELYRVGRGEQGVLLVEPYKSELLPLWRFKTPAAAATSAKAVERAFRDYLHAKDFAGMDMARKFLQMGFTRSRRYANHRSGKKYEGAVPLALRGQSGAHGRRMRAFDRDLEKARSAEIFKAAWMRVERNPIYRELKRDWKIWYG